MQYRPSFEPGAETVSAVLVHDNHDLYDLTVREGPRTAVIHTTASHLFWDTTTHHWVKAAALHAGDDLCTPGGVIATVTGGYTSKQPTGWMWDLTIPGDHDFYIDTAAASVIAHNSSCPITEYSSHSRTQMARRDIAEQMVEQAVASGRCIRGTHLTRGNILGVKFG